MLQISEFLYYISMIVRHILLALRRAPRMLADTMAVNFALIRNMYSHLPYASR